MRPLSELLHRLRRFAAPPGRPGETLAVPVSPVDAAAAELAPVFTALDGLERAARERLERAQREADAILAAGREEALRVRDQGARDAEETRAAILDAGEKTLAGEVEVLLAEARYQAASIEQRAAARTPAFVDRLLAEIEAAAR